MPKDRLKDLQKTSPWPRVSYRKLSRQLRTSELPNGTNDGGQFTSVEMEKEGNVAEFLAQIDLIRILVDKIEQDAGDIRIIHKKMLEPTADPKLSKELDNKTDDVKKLAYDIPTKLKKLEQIQKDQTAADKPNAMWRIKETQIFNLTNRFHEVMTAYNQEFVLHRDRCKGIMRRELEITGNRKTDEELEDILEKGFPGTYSFSIMIDIEKAKQSLNEIEARHRDIKKLEDSIKELHAMFADLAILVTTQGEMIDNIEHNVSKAVDFVEHAAEQVFIARESHEKATKKKFILCIILLAILLILILILAAYFTTQKKLLGR